MPVDRHKVQCRIKEQLGLRTLTNRSELDEEAGGYEGNGKRKKKIIEKKKSIIA